MASGSGGDPPSIISRDAIKVISESVGIADLKDEVADALAPDVEYRLRDIIQEALKFMAHGRRQRLSTEDINHALRLRNCEPLYGFASGEPPRFCRAQGAHDLFYLEDPELNLMDLLNAPLPSVPLEPSFTVHWLAINGAQPTIAQNPTAEEVAAAERGGGGASKRPRLGDLEPPAEVTPLARHSLSAEQQTWLEVVTNAVRDCRPPKEGEPVEAARWSSLASALARVAQDGSTHGLAAHLSAFVASEVMGNLRCLSVLTACVRLVNAMLSSLAISNELERYVHQILPAVLTCVVGKRLCEGPAEDHWRLRHLAALVVGRVLARYKAKYPDLQSRLTRTFLEALQDAKKPLPTLYGAIVGLTTLGPLVVHLLLVPAVPEISRRLAAILDPPPEPAAAAPDASKQQKRHAAAGDPPGWEGGCGRGGR